MNEIVVMAADGGLTKCWGLGTVEGKAVAWACDGHSQFQKCETAHFRFLANPDEGTSFVDSGGQGYTYRQRELVPEGDADTISFRGLTEVGEFDEEVDR